MTPCCWGSHRDAVSQARGAPDGGGCPQWPLSPLLRLSHGRPGGSRTPASHRCRLLAPLRDLLDWEPFHLSAPPPCKTSPAAVSPERPLALQCPQNGPSP